MIDPKWFVFSLKSFSMDILPKNSARWPTNRKTVIALVSDSLGIHFCCEAIYCVHVTILELNEGKWIDIIYRTIGMRIQIRQRSTVSSYSVLKQTLVCIDTCAILVFIYVLIWSTCPKIYVLVPVNGVSQNR